MDWTIRGLHGFWDSWPDERDVLLARGMEHPTDGGATGYATAYGVFIAAAVASLFGAPVQENLTLGGDGGVFDLDSGDGVTSPSPGPLRGRPRPRTPAAHQLPRCSPACRPARVPLCHASRTFTTHLPSRARPDPKARRAGSTGQTSLMRP
jgi:hypothetical protein